MGIAYAYACMYVCMDGRTYVRMYVCTELKARFHNIYVVLIGVGQQQKL